MATYEVDDVDKQILNLLQKNGRYTAIDLAEQVGVSDNTIHNRMDRLEDAGIISGYTASVDHVRAGLSLFYVFTCTARISERSRVAAECLDIPQVVEVVELMTGERNLILKIYGGTDKDITRTAERVDELDLEINDENLIREEHTDALDYVEIEEMLPQEG